MINGLVNTLTSNTFQTLAQNTDACVKIETGLKAIGRPAFTLIDHNTDKETRKYAASKELLYQFLCLGIYMAIIPPVFKRGGFKLAKKIFKKEGLPNFESVKQMTAYHHLAHMKKKERFLPKNKKYMDLITDNLVNPKDNNAKLKDYLEKYEKGTLKKTEKMFELAKGSIEFSSIIGSVIGLTILAPELSHLVLHPAMKLFGLEKNHASKPVESDTKIIDRKA